MPQGPPRRRRARPVADAPIDALILRSEDLTKGWLLALLEEAPLDDAPSIPVADLTRDGPRVCQAVVRALADDGDLRRIEAGGALEWLVSQIGDFAGAPGVEAAARAVDTLGAVIWSAVRAELTDPDPEHVTQLAERLALVTDLVRAATLRRAAAQAGRRVPAAPQEPGGGEVPPGAAPGGAEASPKPAGASRVAAVPDPPEKVEVPASGAGPGVGAGPGTGVGFGGGAASGSGLAPGGDAAPGAGLAPGGGAATQGVPPGAGARIAPVPPPAAERAGPAPGGEPAGAPPSAADLEAAHDPLWIAALEDEVQRSERSGTPLSLLLIELEDAERVLAVESIGEASATVGRFAQAVRSVVRRRDILACETDARAWIIARDTGRLGAHALGSRIIAAVGAARPWRGAPLGVTLGLAVLGQDGREGSSLIEAAEESRFQAAASGITIVDAKRSRGESDAPGPDVAS